MKPMAKNSSFGFITLQSSCIHWIFGIWLSAVIFKPLTHYTADGIFTVISTDNVYEGVIPHHVQKSTSTTTKGHGKWPGTCNRATACKIPIKQIKLSLANKSRLQCCTKSTILRYVSQRAFCTSGSALLWTGQILTQNNCVTWMKNLH